MIRVHAAGGAARRAARRRGRLLRRAVWLVLPLACRAVEPASEPNDAPTSPAEVAVAAPVVVASSGVPAGRGCGEAGPTATALPPALLGGLAAVGRGTVRPGERATVGGVTLHYDPAAWIGTRTAGRRGPALGVEIDRAEAGDGPWGAYQDLYASQPLRVHVGPYRVDGRVAAGEPPARVDVEVAREVCPASATTPASRSPVWMWASTEAIRLHTYDLEGLLLQVGVDGRGPEPRLDVSALGYRVWFPPRPGEPRTIRVRDRVVTIEEVVPGPHTRFDGAWSTDGGDARLHVRARIEPAPAPAAASPPGPPLACGAPSPTRTSLPPELAAPLASAGEATVTPTRPAKLGALTLTQLSLDPLPPLHRWDEPGPRVRTLSFAGAQGWAPTVYLGGVQAPVQAVRVGSDLLRVEDAGDERVRVRRYPRACAGVVWIPPPTGTVHVWLSVLGHAQVIVGTPTTISPLSLQLDPGSGTVSASSPHGHASLDPARAVGEVVSLDAHAVEVVDVVAGAGTRLAERRFVGADGFPVVHVQLRITPSPAPLDRR
jgi:hypothetical protein